MKILHIFLIFLIPTVVSFLFYYFIDKKNKEPWQAILFTTIFSITIYSIEILLVKPSIGKVMSYFDLYLFVYFLAEDREYLFLLSRLQRIAVLFFATLSEIVTYAIGLKMLYVYLYRLGRKKWIAREKQSVHGFIEEPIDYLVYAAIFFIVIAFADNAIYFRNDKYWSNFDISITLVKFSTYLFSGCILGYFWMLKKVQNPKENSLKTKIERFAGSVNKSKLGLFIKSIEILSILILFINVLLLKVVLYFDFNTLQYLLTVINIIGLVIVSKKAIKLGNLNFKIKETP